MSTRIVDVWAVWVHDERAETHVGLTQREIGPDLPAEALGEILVDHLRALHGAHLELHLEELEIRMRVH